MHLPEILEDFVALGAKGIQTVEKLMEKAGEECIGDNSSLINRQYLLPPIASPPKIICLGLNYQDHAEEQNVSAPDEPVIFMKPHTAVIGPYNDVVKPSFVGQLDYEAELAIVMGTRVKDVPASEARSYIFGYTILNDVSARDIQFKDKQWTRGKSFDTFAPMGPCIVTEDQLQDTSDIFIRTWVNDELRQNSSTKNMVLNVNQVVHQLSRVMTLEPCDIIATGTPAGVGFKLKPKPKFLKSGDIVKIEIEKIGILENKIIEKSE
jgi:2-keto-4-pentenoate hydratase/2-oxohepta-3-ene-1,7-dioic acid hydratase in catechol pathway